MLMQASLCARWHDNSYIYIDFLFRNMLSGGRLLTVIRALKLVRHEMARQKTKPMAPLAKQGTKTGRHQRARQEAKPRADIISRTDMGPCNIDNRRDVFSVTQIARIPQILSFFPTENRRAQWLQGRHEWRQTDEEGQRCNRNIKNEEGCANGDKRTKRGSDAIATQGTKKGSDAIAT